MNACDLAGKAVSCVSSLFPLFLGRGGSSRGESREFRVEREEPTDTGGRKKERGSRNPLERRTTSSSTSTRVDEKGSRTNTRRS